MGRILIITLLFIGFQPWLQAQNIAYEEYIALYKDLAIEEMQRTGMPASIKLAQGLIESNAGRSELARRANNHFGIKCGGKWRGGTYHKEDDDYDHRGRLVKSCFRKYDSAETSYVAQSEFLRDPAKSARYGFLFRLETTDYKGWAYGLLKAGYATNQRYAELLIKVIEQYKLYIYDSPTTEAEWVMEEAYEPHTMSINDVKYVLAESGDTPKGLSMDFGVSAKRIIKYNENLYDENQELRAGARVFLQAKRSGFRGKKKYHYVKEEETMFTISQEYGVSLKKLYKKNKMEEGTEPAIGERIKLRGMALFSRRPTLRSEKKSILPHAPRRALEKDDEIEVDIPEGDFLDNEAESTSSSMGSGRENAIDQKRRQKESSVSEKSSSPLDNSRYYTVKKGDTLYSLARKFDISIDKLTEINRLEDFIIRPGQVLKIEE